ncbi:MAG: hypothetical protein JNN03_22675 [Rubrivivax sp.]|nr:hypothetical protein [Rubrivivax sp.]
MEPLGKPDQFISQSYSLKVLPAAGPGRAAVAAPKPRAAQAVTRPELRGGPFTYRIEEDHLKELAAAPKTRTALEALISEAREAQTAAAEPDERAKYATWEALARREMEAGRAGPGPKGQGGEPPRLEKLLAPLKDIDYPTEDLFRDALKLALCAHYGKPPRATGTSPAGDSGVGYEAADLAACRKAMSEEGLRRVDAIVDRARKGHPPERQGDFSLRATPGCGCVPPRSEDEVMGFVSYWGTTEQQQAWRAAAAAASAPTRGETAQVREVDFSLFSRISYFGAVLNDDGLVELPEKVGPPGWRLADEAHRHGTRVDLVVHRSHWETFLRRDDLPRLAARAANSAIGLLGDRQPSGWQKLLLPFWREETHAYDGITVFFDNVPTGDMAEPFLAFREAFLERLVSGMQARKRRYGLNVVVPAERMAETGPYAFEKLIDLVEKAEPVRTSKRVDANEKSLYQGKTDITVTYLVLLPEPASVHKKALRERIDRADPPKGGRRVALLESLVPVLLRSPAGQPPWSRQPPKQQYEDDVAYMKWNFLGTALWELPGRADGDPERAETLRKLYRVDNRRLPALCDVVCPQRLWLRVLLQALVAAGVVAFSLWFFNCAVRGWGVRYEAFLWIGGAVTVPLALAMLECDPALHELSESNVPLMALVALLFAGGLYWSFRLRRARP